MDLFFYKNSVVDITILLYVIKSHSNYTVTVGNGDIVFTDQNQHDVQLLIKKYLPPDYFNDHLITWIDRYFTLDDQPVLDVEKPIKHQNFYHVYIDSHDIIIEHISEQQVEMLLEVFILHRYDSIIKKRFVDDL